MIRRQQGGSILPQVFTNQQDVGPLRPVSQPISTAPRIQTDFSPIMQGIQFGLRQGLAEANFEFNRQQAEIDNEWRYKRLELDEERFNFEKKKAQWDQLNKIKDSITGDDVLITDYDRYKEIIDSSINPDDLEAAYSGDEDAISRIQSGVASIYANPEINKMNRRTKVVDKFRQDRANMIKSVPDGFYDITPSNEMFDLFLQNKATESDLFNSIGQGIMQESLEEKRDLDMKRTKMEYNYKKALISDTYFRLADEEEDRQLEDKIRKARYNTKARDLGHTDFDSAPKEVQDKILADLGMAETAVSKSPTSGNAYLVDLLVKGGMSPEEAMAYVAEHFINKDSTLSYLNPDGAFRPGEAGVASPYVDKKGNINGHSYYINSNGEPTKGTFGLNGVETVYDEDMLKDNKSISLVNKDNFVYLRVEKGNKTAGELLEDLNYTKDKKNWFQVDKGWRGTRNVDTALNTKLDRPDGREIVDAGDAILIPSNLPQAYAKNNPMGWDIKEGVTIDISKLHPNTVGLATMLDQTGLFKITSAYRSDEENKKVGGADGSGHTTGTALDFRWTPEAEAFINSPKNKVIFEMYGAVPKVHTKGTAKHIHVEIELPEEAKEINKQTKSKTDSLAIKSNSAAEELMKKHGLYE